MLPCFLLPETEVRESGLGPVLDLGEERPQTLVFTLGISRILEQQSLDVTIQGSADGVEWSRKPVVTFSQKFYCGTYQMLLDLEQHSETRYLRAKWLVNRWGRGDLTPLFGFYLFAQQPTARAVAGGGLA